MKELNQFELKQVAGGNGIAEDIGWALGRGSRWLWKSGFAAWRGLVPLVSCNTGMKILRIVCA